MENKNLSMVVLVTGSSSGLGRACADRLAERAGNIVFGGSRSEPTGQRWTHVPMDVTDDASVAAAIATVIAREGRIDAVIHCAGSCIAGAIETVSIAEAQGQFDANYFGAVRVIKAVLPGMRERRSGRIVLVASIAGLIALPFQGHYSASKSAMNGLAEALRMEIAPYGIEATIVHPGDFNTPFGLHRRQATRSDPASPYAATFDRAMAFYETAERNGGAADAFARRVERLLARRRLPAKALVGQPLEIAGVWAKSLLPPGIFERLFRLAYGP